MVPLPWSPTIRSFTRIKYKMNRGSLTIILAILTLIGCSAWADINVTFRVDMRYQAGFPQDSVGVQGTPEPLTENAYDNMLADTNKDSVYEGTVTFSDTLMGRMIWYKFAYRYEGSDIIEYPISTQGGNRTFVLPEHDTTLHIVYFDDVDRYPTAIDVTVTFRVSVVYYVDGAPMPDSIAVAGNREPLSWSLGTPPYMIYAGDSIWTANVTFPAGTIPYVLYEYQPRHPLFGWGSEPISKKRVFCIEDTAATQILPIDYLGKLQVGIEENVALASQTCLLLRAYPNPFSHLTEIKYQISDVGSQNQDDVEGTSLKIYDLAGRLVKSFLITNYQSPITIYWDGKDNQGNGVVDGIYFCRIEVQSHTNKNNFVNVQKLILLK